MPAFKDLAKEERVKLLLIGESGHGKTGSLATLANAGFKLRIIDLENNLNVIRSYATEEGINNIHYIPFDPENEKTLQAVEAMIRHWKVGAEDLGQTKTWGNDTVLVIDSATRLGDACLAGTKPSTKDDRSHYKTAGEAFDRILAYTNGPGYLKCNVIFTSHIRYVDVPNAKTPDLLTKRAYPSCLGAKMPTEFGRHFTDVFAINISASGGEVQRTFRTATDNLMGLKCSNPLDVKASEPFDLGLIFRKLLPQAVPQATQGVKA